MSSTLPKVCVRIIRDMMTDGELKRLDGKIISITTDDGVVFEGECGYNSAEYCEAEFGRDESSLQIDDFLFYRDEIRKAEVIEEKQTYIWESRTEHLMELDHEAFRMTEEGVKTIELRLYDEKRQMIRQGDIIRFTDRLYEDETLRVNVEELYIFDDFRKLYAKLPLLQCGYTRDNIEKADPADMDRYYPPEKQASYQVVGIRMSLY